MVYHRWNFCIHVMQARKGVSAYGFITNVLVPSWRFSIGSKTESNLDLVCSVFIKFALFLHTSIFKNTFLYVIEVDFIERNWGRRFGVRETLKCLTLLILCSTKFETIKKTKGRSKSVLHSFLTGKLIY